MPDSVISIRGGFTTGLREHIRLLAEIAPEEFTVLHYGAMAELARKRK